MKPYQKVLIAESDHEQSRVITSYVERLGYNVAGEADTVEQTIKMVVELEPDLVMMDISLPGEINAIEAVAVLKKYINIPFICFAKSFEDSLILKFKEVNGNDELLIMPIDFATLEEFLSKYSQLIYVGNEKLT
ncbi:MAG: response regulator [Balneolaceae bacterium]|nr:MAG: response regulator [Balneolaceae bacterium]